MEDRQIEEVKDTNEMGEASEEKLTSEETKEEREKLSEKQAEAVMEAILFAMGDTVEISRLAQTVGLDPRTVKKILRRMEERYAKEAGKLMLFLAAGSLIMTVLLYFQVIAAVVQIVVWIIVFGILWKKMDERYGA